uniref:Egg-lysin n=1 Tax=Haliotis corrugata TaxID=6453 RepID=Q25034_HALCO|nr:fertilization protein [Haliotis corrugata]prf//2113425E fusagenic protein [Haliotis corrugata]
MRFLLLLCVLMGAVSQAVCRKRPNVWGKIVVKEKNKAAMKIGFMEYLDAKLVKFKRHWLVGANWKLQKFETDEMRYLAIKRLIKVCHGYTIWSQRLIMLKYRPLNEKYFKKVGRYLAWRNYLIVFRMWIGVLKKNLKRSEITKPMQKLLDTKDGELPCPVRKIHG